MANSRSVDGSFLPWSTTLRQRLLDLYPLPDGVEPIADNVLLEPKWLLKYADEVKQDHPSSVGPITSSGNDDVPPDDLLDIPGGLTAGITSNDRLTPTAHWQDVRHITIDIASYHPYVPGDVLTIYPKNFPTDVNEFLSVMGWNSIADTPLRFISTSESSGPNSGHPVLHVVASTPLTLRVLLTNHLDIMSIPRRSFFAHIAHFTEDEFQRDRLLEFTNPEYVDELYDYTTRPRRSILEVLQEFETVKLPWQRLCSIIPAIRGRQFSIASAINPTAEAENRTRIELLIAIVKYRTIIKRLRQGVCTRYVAVLKPGQSITVTLQRGGLGVTKAELDRPVVMVGPGTGVAPMRALTYQRKQWRDESQLVSPQEVRAKDILFFGCRNAESDFFFKSEWEQLKKEGVPLDVHAAFSRDQVGFTLHITCVYLADKMAETEGICTGSRTPEECRCLRGPRKSQWHCIHMRLVWKNASSHSRGANRGFPESWEHGARRGRDIPRWYGKVRAIQTRDMVAETLRKYYPTITPPH